MRTFLALELDEKTRQALAVLQTDLQRLALDASYPRPEQLHVTLCFFGEISERQILEKAEKLASFSYSAFDASVSGIGFFPSPSRVRVVFAGFSEGKDHLIRLQKNVSALLNHTEKESFEPHVTLARIKSEKNKDRLLDFANRHAGFSSSFRANQLALMQSTLSPSGPTYSILKKVRLATS